MPGIPNIDTTNWPAWLVFLLLILNLFKAQLAAVLSHTLPSGLLRAWENYSTRQADREEHDQEIEQVLVNSELQTKATEQLRKVHHEDVLADMVASKDEWIQTTLAGEVQALRQVVVALSERTSANTAAVNRNSELLTAMNGSLSRIAELIQEMPKPPGWLKR